MRVSVGGPRIGLNSTDGRKSHGRIFSHDEPSIDAQVAPHPCSAPCLHHRPDHVRLEPVVSEASPTRGLASRPLRVQIE